MVAEIGGFSGIVVPDEETRRSVRERRGTDLQLDWMCSDEGAEFADTIEVECDEAGADALGAVVSSSALWFLPGSAPRRVQCDGLANERLQRFFIDLVALMEIDGAPGVAFEA